MRSTLLSQAEIHALLYSHCNDSGDSDMLDNGSHGLESDTSYGLSAHENQYFASHLSADSIVPKFYFPLEPMVINCADPFTNRFAEVGITFQIRDAKTAEFLKNLLPALRSAILITLSQKSSDELLSRYGKEKLAREILSEVGRVFGVTSHPSQTLQAKVEKAEVKPSKFQNSNPVVEVLFSSLIVH